MKITVNILSRMIELAHMSGQEYAGCIPAKHTVAKTYTQDLFTKLLDTVKDNEKKVSAGEASKECYECIHKRNVPGNCHIQCNAPDPNMTGDPHGINKGWFMYPILFDPAWKTKVCVNFNKK